VTNPVKGYGSGHDNRYDMARVYAPDLARKSTPERSLLRVQWELQLDEQAAIRDIDSSHGAAVFASNALRDG